MHDCALVFLMIKSPVDAAVNAADAKVASGHFKVCARRSGLTCGHFCETRVFAPAAASAKVKMAA